LTCIIHFRRGNHPILLDLAAIVFNYILEHQISLGYILYAIDNRQLYMLILMLKKFAFQIFRNLQYCVSVFVIVIVVIQRSWIYPGMVRPVPCQTVRSNIIFITVIDALLDIENIIIWYYLQAKHIWVNLGTCILLNVVVLIQSFVSHCYCISHNHGDWKPNLRSDHSVMCTWSSVFLTDTWQIQCQYFFSSLSCSPYQLRK
jgi:hypothetical protein